jgi:5'-3' exonuclease
MKLHLIDATFELFRAHFSRPPSKGPDGRPTNAVAGLLDSTLALLREPDVTHVAAATDHVIASWRNDLYPGYKTDAGVPPELLAQFNDAERALRAIGVTVWPMIVDEADDAIATGVHRFAEQVDQVVICSVDKDLAQCVRDDHVVLRDRIRNRVYAEPDVIEKWGVAPESIPDYLALVGDASDGFPGLPGWGAKSAAAVLRKWRHLDGIPQSALDWEVPLRNATRLAATLEQQRADALLYRRLATLNRDVDLGTLRLDELAWRGVPREEFLALCDELGFTRIRERIHRWA